MNLETIQTPYGTLKHLGTTDTNEAFERMKEIRENVNAPYIPGNILHLYPGYGIIIMKNQHDVRIESDEIFNLIKNDIVIVSNRCLSPLYKEYYRRKNCFTKVYRYLDKDITIDFSNLKEYSWYRRITQFGNSFLETCTPC